MWSAVDRRSTRLLPCLALRPKSDEKMAVVQRLNDATDRDDRDDLMDLMRLMKLMSDAIRSFHQSSTVV